MAQIEVADIKFKVNGKPVAFKVYHNLSDYGLDVNAALDNWFVRTKKFTDASFCQYVMSKGTGCFCRTASEMARIALDELKQERHEVK